MRRSGYNENIKMIEINLLSSKKKILPDKSKKIFFILFLLFLLLSLSFYKLRDTEKILNKKLLSIKNDISNYEDNSSYISALDEKINALEKLKDKKKSPIKFFYVISESFISEQIRITSLSLEKNTAKLKGMATKKEVITQFIQNLKKSGYFSSVELTDFQFQKNSFELICTFKV